jgi:hypothetical protein
MNIAGLVLAMVVFSIGGTTLMLISLAALLGGPKVFRFVNDGLNNSRLWWWVTDLTHDRWEAAFGRA